MSFFDDASLVMIPSGYKTSKVYSVKPTDGTGDLAFTRSNSTATRVASNGLIEKVRTNLITYSQDFGNAAWAVDQLTKTTGQVDPNGGTTAVLLTSTNTFSTYMYQVKAGLGCLSIYAKAGTRSTFALIPTGYNNGAFFDLSSVTATASGIGSLAKIESVGGGWFRCSVATSSSTDFIVSLSNIAGTGSVIGDTMTFAFAQGETGDIATPYIATTTAAVSVGPVANVPRLDYLDSSCPKLLLEPQRSSLVTFSEQMNNAAWTKNAATITANASVSPDGYTNADTLTESTFTSDSAFIYETVVVTPSTAYTTSVFVKQGAGRYVYLRNYYAAGNAYYTVVVDTQTGTITQASVGSSITNASSSIEAYGNGWYRVRATQTSAIEVAFLTVIGLSDIATPTVGTFGQITIASNAGRSASFWGYQLEAGAYATSYIPTLGAAVTRGADAATKTGISSLIGQTEGTLFLEMNINKRVNLGGLGPNGIEISNGSTSGIYLGTAYGASQIFGVYINNAGSFSTLFSTSNNALGTYKMAVGYSSAGFVFYLNGVQIGTSATLPPAVTYSFFGLMTFETITTAQGELANQALLFKTRLSNSDLAALTA